MTFATSADPLTLGGVLRAQADKYPDVPFIVFGERSWSFCRLETESTSLAAALAELGVEPGDRIAIDLPNWPEFAITLFAAAKLGATVVPLNPELAPRDVQFMLRNSEATVVVAAEQYRSRDYLQLFETMLVGLPDLQYVVTVGEEDLWYDDRIYQFEDLVSAGRGRELPDAELDPSEAALAILYTAGTTGKAKGVVLSHANLLQTSGATGAAIGLRPDDITLCAVPLFNIFGISTLLGALLSGSTVVLQERFEPADAVSLVEAHRVTVLHGVPTMFVMALREAGGHDLSSLRTGIGEGGARSEPGDRLRPDRDVADGDAHSSGGSGGEAERHGGPASGWCLRAGVRRGRRRALAGHGGERDGQGVQRHARLLPAAGRNGRRVHAGGLSEDR